MDLRSTQPLTEMSTRNISGDEGRLARKADNLTAVWQPYGPSRPVNKYIFLQYILNYEYLSVLRQRIEFP
jgi:hypothetical protein